MHPKNTYTFFARLNEFLLEVEILQLLPQKWKTEANREKASQPLMDDGKRQMEKSTIMKNKDGEGGPREKRI